MNGRSRGALVASALSTMLLLSSPALAAGPGGGGGGPGGGGGGGGGGGEPVDNTGSLYSDLVIALREANGTPILKMYAVPATETEPATNEYCVQPVSYEPVPGLTMTTNTVDGRDVWVIPLQGEWIGHPEISPIPQDELGACDPQPQYAMFVHEVELERLNLARTSDEVIAQKIADVQTKLKYADQITLGPTGRLSYDGTEIDASPENAGMYQSLMTSGTIPGLHPENLAGSTALVGPAPAPGDTTSNSQFDAWELAAMTIGAAAAKNTPLTLDAVEYYNRVIGFPPDDPTATPPVVYDSPWGVDFVRSVDPNPDAGGAELANSERFVDYSMFSYNRSQTFKGSVTWLDVASLKWKVSKIADVVPFTNLSSYDKIGTNTLHGVTAFAQLADDVRAMCNYVPDNTFIPGFYMDVPGVDTTDQQLKAIHDPAVDIGTLPEDVFKTLPFQVTASLLNPWGGDTIPDARLRIMVDAPTALADGDVTAASADPAGVPVPFAPDGDGNLVGWLTPEGGFPVAPGYNESTTFNVTVGPDAPAGPYTLTLDLVRATNTGTVLATESGTLTVNENLPKVLWADSMVKYATQASSVKIPLQVYAPTADTPGHLTLTISGPGDDLNTPESEALAAGDVKVYGDAGTGMVAMPLTLNAQGELVGTWDATFPAGYTPVTWYATVIEGAPVGNYAFTISLEGSNTLGPVLVAFEAPEQHGEQPPDAGEDTTAPVATIIDSTLGANASFTFTSNEAESTFECMLTTNGVEGAWEACTSPKTYTDLQPGTYAFSVRAIDKAGNVSTATSSEQWTVEEAPPPDDTTPPTVTLVPPAIAGSSMTFTFTADEAVTFACQLEKGDRVQQAFADCTSPKTYTSLKPGSYVFSVRATDQAGNVSEVKTHAWTVTKGGSGGGKPPKQ